LSAKRMAANCKMPVASAEARIVVFQASSLQTISNVALSGPDKATLAAKVTVEPGDSKIFLVLSSTSNVVWNVEGATGRLERVVLLEGTSLPRVTAAAVVGVDPALVSWDRQEDCIQPAGDAPANQIYEAMHGRPIDDHKWANTMASVSVPSLTTSGEDLPGLRPVCQEPSAEDPGKPQPCGWIRHQMLRRFPGGVASFDPKSVVSRRPVELYDVLPSPAGYAAALESGVLSDRSTKNETRYRIEKPLSHFPPFPSGGSRMVFELAPGVPIPAGDTRSFCILDDKGVIVLKGQVNRCINVD
jgi:hypothetical protein